RAGLYDCHSTSERDGVATHGPRAAAHDDGCADALETHAGMARTVVARHGPRRHLDAVDGHASIEERRSDASRPRPREICRARLAMEGRIRRTDSESASSRRRFG